MIDLSTGEPRRYAYADIERLSNAVGRGLLRRGLRRGDRVAVLAANSAEYLLIFLGSLRAGLVCVPVNHKLPAATVAFVLQDCGAAMVICDAARRGLIPDGVPTLTVASDFKQLLDEGPLDPVQPVEGRRRCSSTPRARQDARKAWCCRTTAICGCCGCAPARRVRPAVALWSRRPCTT
jgi:acyl-CoA synthetase (AMP-forming)/AMP-acid ligase II